MANDLACKGLDKIEKTLPILHKPSDQVLCNICLNVKVGMKRKLQSSFLPYCDVYVGLDFVYQELIGSLSLALLISQVSGCQKSAQVSSVRFNCVKLIHYETSSVQQLADQLKAVVLLLSY